ncbi:CHAT domain-containing protein [Kitasatospora purpeofusca]|uniref:CHAT domain-containing protein n=1 Tax=Kitasatospora purpeofusca TaxID=67352 RepID=UPI002A599116|nr:CHAT domain-containing protein [Kitasatospora purpeofusca]MDY0812666.1 CHAT domain-containing protein [Kitasatospora purpeofusca]
MGQWKRRRLLFRAGLHERRGTDPSDVLAGLHQLAADDPYDLEVLLTAAELLADRAGRRSGTAREADLAASIALLHRCVPLVPPGHDDRGRVFNSLGQRLFAVAQGTDSPEPVAESVLAFREAVAATPHGNHMRQVNQFYLVVQLGEHFERSGHRDAPVEAVRVAREGYATVPPGDELHPMFRTALITSLRRLAGVTAHVEPLQEAVGLAREALSEARGTSDRAGAQFDLVRALRAMYDATTDTRLLVEAVDLSEQCLAATPRRDPEFNRRRTRLASAVRLLAQDRRDPDLMRRAIDLMRATIETPSAADEHADTLIDLTQSLASLHTMTDDQLALHEAELTARTAVAAAPDPGPWRTAAQFALATTLLYRSSVDARGTDAVALHEALGLFQHVAAATPPDHRERGDRLWYLGVTLRDLARHGDGDTAAWRRQARHVFAESASAAGPPNVRIKSFQHLGAMEAALGDPHAALAAYEAAVALLPQLTPDWLSYHGNIVGLSQIEGLPDGAAAAALELGRPERAVELLELSRGILHGRTLEARDLRLLRHRSPQLHAEFLRLRTALNTPALNTPARDGNEGNDGNWDDLMSRIRSLDGMAGFLRAPSVHALRRHADQGPVVIVNINERRCDALVLRADAEQPLLTIPLTGLTQADVIAHLLRLTRAVFAAPNDPSLLTRRNAQRDLDEILRWLWDRVTAPVLDALGLTAPSSDTRPPPRIWWCPVGLMAYFPLHAAGHHDSGGKATVMDRAVSSYTTTVRALAGRSGPPAAGTTPRALVVAVPDAEDAPPLPGAAAEAAALTELLPNALVLSGAQATYENVVRALPAYPVAHFSCHGLTFWENPAAGMLLLHDHLTRPLTVEQLSALELPSADLAYLSACSTSHTHPDNADEALHITGAFQLAGYQRVIGTLWPVDDSTSVEITRATYAGLTHGGSTPPRTELSALALNQAVRALRDRYRASPSLWAGYIHVGH